MPRTAVHQKDPCTWSNHASSRSNCRDQPIVIFLYRLISLLLVIIIETSLDWKCTDLRPFSNRPFAMVDAREVVSLRMKRGENSMDMISVLVLTIGSHPVPRHEP